MRDFDAWNSSARGRDARGQTTIDFGIGVSLFLMTIVFIFLFIPSMFTPFVSDQSATITADRTADALATDLFMSGDDGQYTLDGGCTVAFFSQFEEDSTSPPPDRCQYESFYANESEIITNALGPGSPSTYDDIDDEADRQDVEEEYLREVLGLSDTAGIEVTIERINSSASQNVARVRNRDGYDTELRVGSTPPVHGDVVAAQRTIHMEYRDFNTGAYKEADFRLFVRMW